MKIAIIGAGNMGSAMINAWLNKKVCKPSDLLVFDKKAKTHLYCHSRKSGNPVTFWIPGSSPRMTNGKSKIKTSIDDFSFLLKYDVVVLAVKPQNMMEVLESIEPSLSSKTIVLSIAAGITIKRMASVLKKSRIVRSMPNMPVQIGAGVVGWTANKKVTQKDRQVVDKLLGAMGQAVYMSTEKKLDALTAISGSGPAYVFYFMEALFDSAIKLGLNRKEATDLVLGTFVGSSMLVNLSNESPAELREKVTSKKGVTAEAIKVFNKKKLKGIIFSAVKAAHKRAGELNQ